MPELPEVETVKRGLSRLVIGKTVKTVLSDCEKSFPNAKADVDAFLVGTKITGVRRRAKVLLIDLSSDYTLVIHLKMTGQLVSIPSTTYQIPSTSETRFAGGHPNDSLIHNLPDKTTHVTFEFDDGSHLYFNDQRKFGWVRLIPTVQVENIDFMKRLGPEPLEAGFTPEQFISRFQKRPRSTIKSVLLDQSVIAGVGNIYSDESLWGAKIHPATRVGDLSVEQLASLYDEVRYVLNLSIQKGGSTDRNYVDAEGKKGSYLQFARVFRREGLPCPRCGSVIIKIRVAGRGTHICPKEQVL